MYQTFEKSKKAKIPGAKVINGMKLSDQRDTGFYENQNLIGDADRTRMNDYSKGNTSARSRQPDSMDLTYPITRYRSRRP
jgi:hypothetical protein